MKTVKILSVVFWISTKKRLLTNIPHNKLETYQAHIPKVSILWSHMMCFMHISIHKFSICSEPISCSIKSWIQNLSYCFRFVVHPSKKAWSTNPFEHSAKICNVSSRSYPPFLFCYGKMCYMFCILSIISEQERSKFKILTCSRKQHTLRETRAGS